MKFSLPGAIGAALFMAPGAFAQLSSYSQDFEAADPASPTALSDDGWVSFVNVFDSGGGYITGYFVGGAPNGTGTISAIAGGLGGPDQGFQYANIFSDYANPDHSNGSNNNIETNVFRETVISAGDAGTDWTLSFDYLKNPFVGPNGDGDTTTQAFIKVLKQSDGSFATLAFPIVDTTGASTSTWASGSIDITIDPSWVGEIFQFGFASTVDNGEDSGRFYDNITFEPAAGPGPSLTAYSQDFEAMDAASGTVLGDDGWTGFANVFDPMGGYLYGYGTFPAPNGTPGFSSVAGGDGGPFQGSQYLNIYSDYNNGDHGNGNVINALVFQESPVGAVDIGNTWRFQFDQRQAPANANNGATTTQAFIKVLKISDNSFATLIEKQFDTTNLPQTVWSRMALDLVIDASYEGELVQFGFSSFCTNFEDSGRFYDNITFSQVMNPGIGEVLCIGERNSTSGDALLTASGSTAVADNNLSLTVDGMPANVMGLFFQSPTGVTVYNPAGSEGHLCIASFDMGRFPAVMSSGAGGTMTQAVDLNALPGANGAIAVMAGETRLFQNWHRDNNGMGATSNFSSAVSITFN